MTATLDTLKADLAALHVKLAEYEAARARTITIPRMEIELREGEHYAGIALTESGAPSHHLIRVATMPGKADWDGSMAWAKKLGIDLPTPAEQALLYANCKDKFEAVAHWSNTQDASYSDFAWCQHFSNGLQHYVSKSSRLSAVGVRRLPIQ